MQPGKSEQPHYLIEVVNGKVLLHRKLNNGETMWYNSKQVKMFNNELFIVDVKEFGSVAAGIEYVFKIWKHQQMNVSMALSS